MLGLLAVLFLGRIQPVLVIVEANPVITSEPLHSLLYGGDWSAYQFGGQYWFQFYDDVKDNFYPTPSNVKVTRSADNNSITFGGWGVWFAPDGSQKTLYYSFALTKHSGAMPTFVWRLRPYTAPGTPLQPLTTDVSGTISNVKSLQW